MQRGAIIGCANFLPRADNVDFRTARIPAIVVLDVGLFVVKKDSPYKSLQDLKGKRMMFTSPTSTSGYVMAYSRLVDEGLLQPKENPNKYFGEVRFAGGYDRALLAVLNDQWLVPKLKFI